MRTALTFGFIALTPFCFAQFGLPKPPVPVPELGIDRMIGNALKGESPLTTSLKDGWVGAKFLDGFEPEFAKGPLPQIAKNGTFMLGPGAYEFHIQSFCARGYSPGPNRGMGYTRAPYQGKHAQIVQNIVRRHSTSSVRQGLTQELIWAILARSKPSTFHPELKSAAAELLTTDEIAKLEGYSLDQPSEEAMNRLLGKVDQALRPIMQAENQVRTMVSNANRPFDELERLMVLPPDENLPTISPRNRWLWNPKGYFYRLKPQHYSQSMLQIVIPRKPEILKDAKGRITKLLTPGCTSEVVYDDSIEQKPFPDDPKVIAHPIKFVRLTMQQNGQILTFEKQVSSFIFKGTPSKRKRKASQFDVLYASVQPQLGWFNRWYERYQAAQEQRDRYNEYREFYDRYRRIEDHEASADDFFDLDHYRDGVREVATGGDGIGWIADHHARQAEAVGWATDRINELPNGTEVDVSDSVFQPGNPGSQRLLGSARGW